MPCAGLAGSWSGAGGSGEVAGALLAAVSAASSLTAFTDLRDFSRFLAGFGDRFSIFAATLGVATTAEDLACGRSELGFEACAVPAEANGSAARAAGSGLSTGIATGATLETPTPDRVGFTSSGASGAGTPTAAVGAIAICFSELAIGAPAVCSSELAL